MNLADRVYSFKCGCVLYAFMEHGSITKAAKALGIHRNTFMVWLKRARELGHD